MHKRQIEEFADYLASLRMTGVCAIFITDELVGAQIRGSLNERGVSVVPLLEASTVTTSTVVVDGGAISTATPALSKVLASKERPLIFLIESAANVPDAVGRRLLPHGYLHPERPLRDTPVLELRHAEHVHKRHYDVAAYWEDRYASGGNSGVGSHGRLARFKARFLNSFVREHEIGSVVELGSGDGAQLALAEYPEYTGLDISETAIDLCRAAFRNDESKHFVVYDPDTFVADSYRAELVLSLDVIYHLSSDDLYHRYLDHLFALADRYVVIYASADPVSPSGVDESAGYIRFRDFLADIERTYPEWKLGHAKPNRFPYSRSNPSHTSFADFYVFVPRAVGDIDAGVANYQREKILNTLAMHDENDLRASERLARLSDDFKDVAATHSKELHSLRDDHEASGRHIENVLDRLFADLRSVASAQSEEFNSLRHQHDTGVSTTRGRLEALLHEIGAIEQSLSGQYVNIEKSQDDHRLLARTSLEDQRHTAREVNEVKNALTDLTDGLLQVRRDVSRSHEQLRTTVERRVIASHVASAPTGPRGRAGAADAGDISAHLEELKRTIVKSAKSARKLRARNQMLESSRSYRLGRVIIDALKWPGKEIVAVPGRLLGAFKPLPKPDFNEIEALPELDTALQTLVNLRNALKTLGHDGSRDDARWHERITLRDEPVWFALSLPTDAAVNVRTWLDNGVQDRSEKRSVVALLECVDKHGREIKKPPSGFAYSERLACYFKYVPVSDEPIVLAGFVPPSGTRHILIGFRTFHGVRRRRYELRRFSLDAGPGTAAARIRDKEELSDARPARSRFTPPSQAAMEAGILGWPPPPDTDTPLALVVMDEFTEGCFADDLRLLQPRPDNWYGLAEKYPPDLVFVESAWKGNGGSWQYRVGSYSVKPGTELAHMTAWARQRGIPSVFWNKEDPVHHKKFVEAAGLTDYIFTTDANMVDSYRRATGSQNVYALPFAAQPELHKPASLEGRIPKACFAGSWYGDRHEERGEAMKWLLRAGLKHGLDIFDRNYGTGKFPFPEQYQESIRGSLPYLQLCEEYRRYRVFLNVNSVTDSPTMFSRRVFELLASGTPVVSTYARGIEEMFGNDIVWFVRDAEEADEALRTLLEDDIEWRRRSLAGIRAVFAEHTYAHRLNQVFETIGVDKRVETTPSILLFARARTTHDIERLGNIAAYQTYRSFQVLISSGDHAHAHGNLPTNVTILPEASFEDDELKQKMHGYAAVGWISPECRYGTNYLRDLANALLHRKKARGWAKATGDDRFSYGHAAHLAGAIWEPDAFTELWSSRMEWGEVEHDELFVIDADEFEAPV